MLIPKFWAEAQLPTGLAEPKSKTVIRRFGWSDSSQDEAQAHAQERVKAALDQFLQREAKLPKDYLKEPKVPYNGAEGVPIREETVMEHGQAVITRNSYGALCLNTEEVLFADVDFEEDALPSALLTVGLALTLAAVTCLVLRPVTEQPFTGAGTVVSYIFFQWLVGRGLTKRLVVPREHREQEVLDRLESFLKKNPDWHVRAYRTPRGVRLMAIHSVMDPNDEETHAFFTHMGSDPLYVKMCQRQQCFRARLTPKPWNTGMERLHPAGVWPLPAEDQAKRNEWVRKYERTSEHFAACKFLGEFGNTNRVDHRTSAVRDLHDRLTKAHSDLPLG